MKLPGVERAARVGLTDAEYARIVELVGREPGDLELDLFGVMWSEHCSYKTSRPLLSLFPTTGAAVLQGPGENAGIVDIGDGLAVVMKVESHNHPSAVEPYQGAATGSGGIIRDIFTMGARPIAMLDSLRFGDLGEARQRSLFRGVVKGIGDYDNCMGIPTVAGEVGFDDSYAGNCLVNAMCVGIIRHGDIKRGAATGVGNPVILVGATTGRDGMGGASFASVDLTAASQERKSAVQVGDPFLEKLLLEACLELFRTDAVVGIQDLGAAGLTSASCETAARGSVGIDLDVAPGTASRGRDGPCRGHDFGVAGTHAGHCAPGARRRRTAHLRQVGPERRGHRTGHGRWHADHPQRGRCRGTGPCQGTGGTGTPPVSRSGAAGMAG